MKSRSNLIRILSIALFFTKASLASAAGICIYESLSSTDEDIKREIESISNCINQSIYEPNSKVEILELYNARGLRYFCAGLFEDALIDFNQVLNAIDYTEKTEEPFLALALWGRLLCHSHLDQEAEAFEDLELFHSYFLNDCLPCIDSEKINTNFPFFYPSSIIQGYKPQNASSISKKSSSYPLVNTRNKNLNYSNYVHLVAEFANPNERLSTENCKNRVKGTADIMRLFTAKLPSSKLAVAINIAISRL